MDCGWSCMSVKLMGRDCMKLRFMLCMVLVRGWRWCVSLVDWLGSCFVFPWLKWVWSVDTVSHDFCFILKCHVLFKTYLNGIRLLGLASLLSHPHLLWPIVCLTCFQFISILFMHPICHVTSFYFFCLYFFFWFYFNTSNAPKIPQKFMNIF